MKTLKISENLSLPLEVAGQAVVVLGIRGSGKTNTAGVLAEELLDQHQPICVIDPTNAWWGLRAGRDGKAGGGYPVFIFGGSHGDLPLHETDGKVIAEFLVREQVSVILSLRHLRKGAQRRFVTEFCEELYHLKGDEKYRTALTVFIDEAPLFAPNKVVGDVARMVGAVEDLIARGRTSGFGVVLISQRSATLNADIRTQADTMICHRVPSKLDRKSCLVSSRNRLMLWPQLSTSCSRSPAYHRFVLSSEKSRLKISKRLRIRRRQTVIIMQSWNSIQPQSARSGSLRMDFRNPRNT